MICLTRTPWYWKAVRPARFLWWHGNGGAYVTVSFDAPVFGIWSPSGDAPFVCIEPWYGVSDREDFNKELRERKWSQSLKPGEVFEGGYTISV